MMFIVDFHFLSYKDGKGHNNVLVEQPALIEVEAGKSVTINCTFKAESQHYSVIWSLGCSNRSPIHSEVCYRQRVTLLRNQITIFNLTENDSGTYCCHVDLYGGYQGTGNGTRIVVTQRGKQNHADSKRQDTKYILYSIIGFEFCIIIALLVFVINNRLQGSRDTHKKDEEHNMEPTLHYAEIANRKVPSRPRSKHTEEKITYAPIKTQR
ncbi:uncharacterized protein LOC128636587 [Bombina bombina]|uniref:uncharacterized protein LOC128636587 n=1 Tax=Bombina bombina TaxID=8345 RepID=UPI00235A82F2|nr:uncharacterized protein LOC128636587 [Bombina bombina]